jgi:Cytochrome oxidase complex assembly protein 1
MSHDSVDSNNSSLLSPRAQNAGVQRSSAAPKRRRIGALGLIANLSGIALVLAVGLGAVAFGLGVGLLKRSDAYRTSLAFVQTDPRVIASLGEPIEAGSMPMGSLDRKGASGSSQLSIQLHGPRGKGTAHVTAHRDRIRWIVDTAKLEADGGVLSLLP